MGQIGRPTKYRPEFCQMLIEHMARGFSFESFAGVVDVSEATLYEWTKPDGAALIPEFLEAKKAGFAKCRLVWEAIGIQGVTMGKQFNQSLWIFNMKNRFPRQWRDRLEVEKSGKVEHSGLVEHKHQHTVASFDLTRLSLEELEQLDLLTKKLETTEQAPAEQTIDVPADVSAE